MKFTHPLLLTAVIATLSACMATATPSYQTALGKVLTDTEGKTLYTFKKDTLGVSNCNGGCAQKWPPYSASHGAKPHGDFAIIKRADGSHQWTYKNQPLYTWVGDSKKGDASGHGIKNIWFAAIIEHKPEQSNQSRSHY